MTRRILSLALAVAAAAGAARADDCPSLGLHSDYLTAYFCDQAARIIAEGTTRTIDPEQQNPPEGPGFDWAEVELLRDAWRVDPKKTLELIQRIRTAGGLPES